MTFNLFTQKVQAALCAYFGEDMILDVQKVTKNNGIELTGVIIREKDSDVASTIYLDQFFSEYEDGVPMSEIVREIIRIYEENRSRQKMDLSFFSQYETVKDKISCRLINRERNSKLLARVPYRVMENLAMVYQCTLIGDEFGCASVIIEYSHLRYWQVTEEQLFKDALVNMPLILPARQIPMRQLLCEKFRSMIEENMDEYHQLEKNNMSEEEWDGVMEGMIGMLPGRYSDNMDRMRILTNCHEFYGAAVILYPGLLEKLAEEFSQSFYILPSSVHEVILLAFIGKDETEELKELVRDVNRTNVSEDEFLSDDIYYYRKGDGYIRKL